MSKYRLGRRRKIDSSTSLADDDEVNFEDGGWECTVCTFRNKSESFKCEMCDVRKGTSTRKPRINSTVVEQQQSVQKFVQQQQHAMMSQAHKERSRGATDRNSTCSAASTRDADSPSSMSVTSRCSVGSPPAPPPSSSVSASSVVTPSSPHDSSTSPTMTPSTIGKSVAKRTNEDLTPTAAKPPISISKESSHELATTAKRPRTVDSVLTSGGETSPPVLLPAAMISPSGDPGAAGSSGSPVDAAPSPPIGRPTPGDCSQPSFNQSDDENDPPLSPGPDPSYSSTPSFDATRSTGPSGSVDPGQAARPTSTRGRKKGSVNGVRRKPPKTFFRKHVDQNSARTLSVTVNGLTVVITDYKLLGSAESINNGTADDSKLESTIESLIHGADDDVTDNPHQWENSEISQNGSENIS